MISECRFCAQVCEVIDIPKDAKTIFKLLAGSKVRLISCLLRKQKAHFLRQFLVRFCLLIWRLLF